MSRGMGQDAPARRWSTSFGADVRRREPVMAQQPTYTELGYTGADHWRYGMSSINTIALVAHDNCKADLIEWADYNSHHLAARQLVATGTTVEEKDGPAAPWWTTLETWTTRRTHR